MAAMNEPRLRVESSDLESLYTQSPGVFNDLQMLMQQAVEENKAIDWNSNSEVTPESSPIIPLVTGTPSRTCQMPLCFKNLGRPLSIEDIYETELSGSTNNHMSPYSKHGSHNFIREDTNVAVPPAGEVHNSGRFSSASTQSQGQEPRYSNAQPEVDSDSIDSQETQMLLPCRQVHRTPDNKHHLVTGIREPDSTHHLVTGSREPAKVQQLSKTAPVPSSPASDLETVAGSPQSQSLLHPSFHQGSAQVYLPKGKTGPSENERIAGEVTELTQEGKEKESSQLSNLSNSGKSELEKAKAEHEKDVSLMNRLESQQAKASRALSAGDPAAAETVQQILDKLKPLLASLSTKCNKERVGMTTEFSRAKKSRKPVIKQKIQWLCQRQKKLVTLFTAHRSITQKLQELKQCILHKTAEHGEKSVTVEDETPVSKTQKEQIQKLESICQIKENTTSEVYQLGINKTKTQTLTKCMDEAGPIVLKGTNLITERPSVSPKSSSEGSQSLIPSAGRGKISDTPEERLLSQNTIEGEIKKVSAFENDMNIVRTDGDTIQNISGLERNTPTGGRKGLVGATNDSRLCFNNDISYTSFCAVSEAHLTNVNTKTSAKQMNAESTRKRAESSDTSKETLNTGPCPTNTNVSLHPETPKTQTNDTRTTVVKVSCGIYTNLLNNEPATVKMIKNLPGILTQPAERVQVENFDDPTQKFRLSDKDQVTSAFYQTNIVDNMASKGALQPKGADLSLGPGKDLVIHVVSVPNSSESVGTSNKWKENFAKQNSFTAGSLNKSSSKQATLSSKDLTGVDNTTSNTDPNNDKLKKISRLSSPSVAICSQRTPPPWSSPTSTVSTVDPTAPDVKKLRGAADIAKLFRAAQQQRKKAVTRLKKPVCKKLPVSILKKPWHAAAPAVQARKSKFAQQRKTLTKKPLDREKHTDRIHEPTAQPRQTLQGNIGKTAKLKPRKVVLIDDRELFPNKGFLPDNFWTAKGFAGVTIPSCLIKCLEEW